MIINTVQSNPNTGLNIVWLMTAVLVWGLVHSLTASLGAKERARRGLGESGMRFYRLAYNIFSVLSFLPILWSMAILPDQALYRIPPPWVYLALAGQALAVVVLATGVLQTGVLSFVGLKQLFDESDRSGQLVTNGLYRWVRHPLYTAGLLFIWLTPVMSLNTLVFYVAATLYIIVGAFFEERKLEREFGGAYVDYKASTPMFVPGLKFGWNKNQINPSIK